MKKTIISLEVLLIIIFFGFSNVGAYVSGGITYGVSFEIYNEDTKKFEKQDEYTTALIMISDTGGYINDNGKTRYNLIVPSKEGYIFDGWYYDKDFTKKVEDNDTRNISLESLSKSNHILYGKWNKNIKAFHIVPITLISILVFVNIILNVILFKKHKKIINKLKHEKNTL